jgi:hypothetical protein
VYGGTDPLTVRRHYLRESIPAGPNAEAQNALRRLGTQVDERRNLRTNATVVFGHVTSVDRRRKLPCKPVMFSWSVPDRPV